MAVVTLEQLKAQLGFTDDIGAADDALLTGKLAAAQNHIERLLGFKIEEQFEKAPPALGEAVLQLAAWWYDQREAVNVENIVSEVPFNVSSIVQEFREWSF